jgi:hypothetical protein
VLPVTKAALEQKEAFPVSAVDLPPIRIFNTIILAWHNDALGGDDDP